jgi:23S rRNA (adenine1618-N6)-methyltransferase
MVCDGGELAFVRKMVDESVELQGAVHWYTSMLGRKNTLKALKLHLHQLPITAMRTAQLTQGRTMRWAVAWSFVVPKCTASIPLRAAM